MYYFLQFLIYYILILQDFIFIRNVIEIFFISHLCLILIYTSYYEFIIYI